MPQLTTQQRNLLIQQCNTAPLNFLLQNILEGNITLEELTNLNEARKAVILEKILPLLQQKEQEDWNNLSPYDRQSILNFYRKYPQTTHFNEIDDYFWNTLDLNNIDDLDLYASTFNQNGKHLNEVEERKLPYNSLKKIDLNDIFAIHNFIITYPNFFNIEQAKQQLYNLKEKELQAMKDSPSSYEVEKLRKLVNNNIISIDDLVNHQIFKSADAFTDYLKRLDKSILLLPDINKTIEDSIPDPLTGNGNTDIFLFGIPSTGKTCVLMGLSSTNDLQVSLIGGGGEYAAALQLYTEAGKTIGRTPGDFVTTLNAKINDKNNVHNINIIEMSGEEFAYDIVHNQNKKFTFEDMASGTTEILKNDNKKVFFIIIDPTADSVNVKREIKGINEYGELVVTDTQTLLVNQRIAINKLINIFDDNSNAAIMKKVDAIHFIMTKADMLEGQNGMDRETNAINIFNQDYKNYVLQPLINICEKYNINYSTRHLPKLFTFSLGDFYIGGLYDYNPTDSNRLVTAIKNVTQKQHKLTFWDKVRKFFN